MGWALAPMCQARVRTSDRNMNGSNLTDVNPHVSHTSVDLSCPCRGGHATPRFVTGQASSARHRLASGNTRVRTWNRSTMIDRLRFRYASHASSATTTSGRPSESFSSAQTRHAGDRAGSIAIEASVGAAGTCTLLAAATYQCMASS